MENFLHSNEDIPANRFLWIGICIGILYWFLESLMHITVFGEGLLIEHVFTPDAHEIWKRLSVLGLIIMFSVYANRSINIRRRTETALAEREQELSRILENNPAGIILVDTANRMVSWANNNALKMIGAARETVENRECHKHLCLGEAGQCPVLDSEMRTDRSEGLLLTTEGKSLPILKSVTRVKYNGREHLLETFFDLSDRKKMERELQQAHAELDQIFQTASVAMRLVDTEFNVLKVNKTFVDLMGVDETEVIQRKCHEVFSGTHCFTENCPINRIVNSNTRVEASIDKKRPDGKRIPCILTATPFLDRNGEVVGIVESFRDITELKKAQEAVESERDKLERILSHLQEGVNIITSERVIEYKNDKFRAYFGQCEGMLCHEAIHGSQQACVPCLMQQAIETGRVQMAEFKTSTGQFFEKAYTPIMDIDNRHKVVALLRDVSEKKAATDAIMRAEQLAALGELAAGVAHEINNPINGVINYAQILANKSEEGSHEFEIATRLIREGDRIARIVEGLLSFARSRHDEKTDISISDVMTDSMSLTAAQLRKDYIIVEIDIPDGLPDIWAQAHEIEQVCINIISNSRHSLNEKYLHPDDNKRLEIKAEKMVKNGEQSIGVFFKDYGLGIPKEIINNVMNPFFSTKLEGKRTGLGLSISQAIVDEHGGRLYIESEEGIYTTICMELPCRLESNS